MLFSHIVINYSILYYACGGAEGDRREAPVPRRERLDGGG